MSGHSEPAQRSGEDAGEETDSGYEASLPSDKPRYADLDTVSLDGTTTVDLYDRVDEILDDALPAEEERLEDLYDEARGASEPDQRAALQQDIAEVEERIRTLEHTASVFHTCAEEWGGSTFSLKTNLAFHEVQAASDDIAEMTVASGLPEEVASAKRGAYKLRVLMFGIEQAPPDAPEPNADGFPWQVGQYLYQQFDDLNSRGGVSAGNSSLPAEEPTE